MKTSERKCIVAMPSITYAMSGEARLASSGIYVRVVKLPPGSTKKGCTYGLEVVCTFLEKAVDILESYHIKHGEILR